MTEKKCEIKIIGFGREKDKDINLTSGEGAKAVKIRI